MVGSDDEEHTGAPTRRSANLSAEERERLKRQYRGVFWDRKTRRWRCQLGYQSKKIFLGYFDDAGEAAKAYDQKLVELRGAGARTNFPITEYLHLVQASPLKQSTPSRAKPIKHEPSTPTEHEDQEIDQPLRSSQLDAAIAAAAALSDGLFEPSVCIKQSPCMQPEHHGSGASASGLPEAAHEAAGGSSAYAGEQQQQQQLEEPDGVLLAGCEQSGSHPRQQQQQHTAVLPGLPAIAPLNTDPPNCLQDAAAAAAGFSNSYDAAVPATNALDMCIADTPLAREQALAAAAQRAIEERRSFDGSLLSHHQQLQLQRSYDVAVANAGNAGAHLSRSAYDAAVAAALLGSAGLQGSQQFGGDIAAVHANSTAARAALAARCSEYSHSNGELPEHPYISSRSAAAANAASWGAAAEQPSRAAIDEVIAAARQPGAAGASSAYHHAGTATTGAYCGGLVPPRHSHATGGNLMDGYASHHADLAQQHSGAAAGYGSRLGYGTAAVDLPEYGAHHAHHLLHATATYGHHAHTRDGAEASGCVSDSYAHSAPTVTGQHHHYHHQHHQHHAVLGSIHSSFHSHAQHSAVAAGYGSSHHHHQQQQQLHSAGGHYGHYLHNHHQHHGSSSLGGRSAYEAAVDDPVLPGQQLQQQYSGDAAAATLHSYGGSMHHHHHQQYSSSTVGHHWAHHVAREQHYGGQGMYATGHSHSQLAGHHMPQHYAAGHHYSQHVDNAGHLPPHHLHRQQLLQEHQHRSDLALQQQQQQQWGHPSNAHEQTQHYGGGLQSQQHQQQQQHQHDVRLGCIPGLPVTASPGAASDVAAFRQRLATYGLEGYHQSSDQGYVRGGNVGDAGALPMFQEQQQQQGSAGYEKEVYAHSTQQGLGFSTQQGVEASTAALDPKSKSTAVDIEEDYDAEAAWVQRVRGGAYSRGTGEGRASGRSRNPAAFDSDDYDVNEDDEYDDDSDTGRGGNRRSRRRNSRAGDGQLRTKHKTSAGAADGAQDDERGHSYRGVFWDKKSRRWRCQLGFKNKKIFLGYFSVAEEAARAYDQKLVELHGGAAKTNFPIQNYLGGGTVSAVHQCATSAATAGGNSSDLAGQDYSAGQRRSHSGAQKQQQLLDAPGSATAAASEAAAQRLSWTGGGDTGTSWDQATTTTAGAAGTHNDLEQLAKRRRLLSDHSGSSQQQHSPFAPIDRSIAAAPPASCIAHNSRSVGDDGVKLSRVGSGYRVVETPSVMAGSAGRPSTTTAAFGGASTAPAAAAAAAAGSHTAAQASAYTDHAATVAGLSHGSSGNAVATHGLPTPGSGAAAAVGSGAFGGSRFELSRLASGEVGAVQALSGLHHDTALQQHGISRPQSSGSAPPYCYGSGMAPHTAAGRVSGGMAGAGLSHGTITAGVGGGSAFAAADHTYGGGPATSAAGLPLPAGCNHQQQQQQQQQSHVSRLFEEAVSQYGSGAKGAGGCTAGVPPSGLTVVVPPDGPARSPSVPHSTGRYSSPSPVNGVAGSAAALSRLGSSEVRAVQALSGLHNDVLPYSTHHHQPVGHAGGSSSNSLWGNRSGYHHHHHMHQQQQQHHHHHHLHHHHQQQQQYNVAEAGVSGDSRRNHAVFHSESGTVSNPNTAATTSSNSNMAAAAAAHSVAVVSTGLTSSAATITQTIAQELLGRAWEASAAAANSIAAAAAAAKQSAAPTGTGSISLGLPPRCSTAPAAASSAVLQQQQQHLGNVLLPPPPPLQLQLDPRQAAVPGHYVPGGTFSGATITTGATSDLADLGGATEAGWGTVEDLLVPKKRPSCSGSSGLMGLLENIGQLRHDADAAAAAVQQQSNVSQQQQQFSNVLQHPNLAAIRVGPAAQAALAAVEGLVAVSTPLSAVAAAAACPASTSDLLQQQQQSGTTALEDLLQQQKHQLAYCAAAAAAAANPAEAMDDDTPAAMAATAAPALPDTAGVAGKSINHDMLPAVEGVTAAAAAAPAGPVDTNIGSAPEGSLLMPPASVHGTCTDAETNTQAPAAAATAADVSAGVGAVQPMTDAEAAASGQTAEPDAVPAAAAVMNAEGPATEGDLAPQATMPVAAAAASTAQLEAAEAIHTSASVAAAGAAAGAAAEAAGACAGQPVDSTAPVDAAPGHADLAVGSAPGVTSEDAAAAVAAVSAHDDLAGVSNSLNSNALEQVQHDTPVAAAAAAAVLAEPAGQCREDALVAHSVDDRSVTVSAAAADASIAALVPSAAAAVEGTLA